MVLASGLLRSTASDRLLRFQARKFGLSLPPTQRLLKVIVRNRSPCPGRSTLMTLAPRSARSCVQNGPCRRWLKSRTTTSARAFSVMGFLRSGSRRQLLGHPAPERGSRRVRGDLGDMPAAEIGRVEGGAVKGDVGR